MSTAIAIASTTTATTTPAAALSSKKVIYVGALSDNVKENLIRAAFLPFGPLTNVYMPMDYVKGTHRGFAFVEMDQAEDAEEAIFNMDGAELMGRVIRVSLAQANQMSKLNSTSSSSSSGAVWTSDEWFQQQNNSNQEQDNNNNNDETAAAAETKKETLAALGE
eukprot:CAMPEP_0198148974 /NCGR_PEP_ID=MMETSP1443-20131203/44413_1 /TAXON_ID=186043 /ORGANISM="Entomoneis sp., Strain CCMP2396" /LENGTH=163 /DNA_ID=CAMNT_0043813857 /DNA_START=67 /DNA_END=558 /DNA_ORIENTATION=-